MVVILRIMSELAEVFISNGELTFLQRMFYSLGLKMSELSDSVQKKRLELQRLLRAKVVKEIVESQVSKSDWRQYFLHQQMFGWWLNCFNSMQIPYLEQWETLHEEEYLTSVSETSEALLNASLRLPFDADIKVCIVVFD